MYSFLVKYNLTFKIAAVFLTAVLFFSGQALAVEKVEVKFFYSTTCSHCARENQFLKDLEKEYPLEIERIVVTEGIDLLKEFYEKYDVPKEFQGLVPITFIGEKYFLGFDDEIGKEIKNCIASLLEGSELCDEGSQKGETSVLEQKINIPFIGSIRTKDFSLPALTFLLGFLDGFNVCSLGALILILGLVLALKSRKKTLIFGGAFIFITAIVYGLLIVVWYQIFSLLTPYLRFLEIFIGLLGIVGGIYFLKEFIRIKRKGLTCEVGAGEGIMARFSQRFKEGIKKPGNILFLLISIIVFAGIITIIEFPCSAAIPVIYAGILARAGLPAFFYLLYIAAFIFFYMLDEIIVFLIAVFTMSIWMTSPRFVVWITLIEALVLFVLGLYYLLGAGFIL